MREPDDAELRRLFAELRQTDGGHHPSAPSFAVIWERAALRAGRHRPVSRAWRLATAGALIAAVLVGVIVWRRVSAPARQAVEISRWQSPTEFLLRGPGGALLSAVPTITTSAVPLLPTTNASGGTP
ncbi:MAG: hypothetical protein ACREMW_15890 [Gemmatimonadales bacterium]